MLQTVLENQIARRTFDDCSLAFLSRQGQRFGRWECLTPRQQAAIFGVTTQNKSRRRHKLRKLRQSLAAESIRIEEPG